MRHNLSQCMALLATALLGLCGSGSRAQTISVDTTWGPGNHVLTGNLVVQPGVTLTLQPGCVVKGWEQSIAILGTLKAIGTAGNPVTFTTAGSAELGAWRGIYLGPQAGASVLSHCNILWGGDDFEVYYAHERWLDASLYVDGCNPQITDCVISGSHSEGIEIWSGKPVIQRCNFADNRFSDMRLATLDAAPIMGSNTISGGGVHYITVAAGTFAESTRWNEPGGALPYRLGGNITVPDAATWTLDPGVVIQSAETSLLVNGVLDARGTSAKPVTFTCVPGQEWQGAWHGIYLGPASGASRLDYCIVDWGGDDYELVNAHGANQDANLYIDSCSPSITNSVFRGSHSDAIELFASNATITGCTFQGSRRSGLVATSGSFPVVGSCTFTGNGGGGAYDVRLDAGSLPNHSATTFAGGAYPGIQITGGTVPPSTTWRPWAAGESFMVTGSVTVPLAGTLTVAPATCVKFADNTGLYVNGTLTADGTASEIQFTSIREDAVGGNTNGGLATEVGGPGDWLGIYLSPAAGASVLTHCRIAHGGDDGELLPVHAEIVDASLFVDGCNPTISNCRFEGGMTEEVEFWSSTATLKDCEFKNHTSGRYAIAVRTLDSMPAMSGNFASGVGGAGVWVPAGTIGANVRWNLPGAGIRYTTGGDLTVEVGATLTLDPGVTLRFYDKSFVVYGTLRALGTPELPVEFTSTSSSVSSGDWHGIYLGPAAGASVLKNCRILGGGDDYELVQVNGTWVDASLYIDHCSPVIENLVVDLSFSDGIEMISSSSVIRGCQISRSAWSALRITGGSTARILNGTLVASGGAGLSSDNSAVTLSNCIVTNNARGVDAYVLPPSVVNTDVWNNGTNWSGASAGTGCISVDPGYANYVAANYRLGAGSQCANAGDDSVIVAGATDIDGKPRRIGLHVDLGAYESGVYFSLPDIARGMRITGGLVAATSDDISWLNVVAGALDLKDCVRLARKASGLEVNP